MNLFDELKRRNVFRVGIAYAVVAWLVMQFADVVLNNIVAPGWVFQAIMLLLAIGFPIVLVFAWAFEMTPEGLKKEKDIDRSQSIAPRTGRKLDRAIIVILALALAYFAYDKFIHKTPQNGVVENAQTESTDETGSDSEPPGAPSVRIQSDKSVAVLPFAFRSTNQEDQFFAEGMHDDLLTQLAKIGSLKVISRTSVLEYKDTTKKIPEIAAELGVSTIVEGGVQRSGSRIRFNAQLIDAHTDEHLWAETYDRELTAENLFDIQAEIARAIATALQTTLSPEEEASIDRVLTSNLAAWESYQRAVIMRQTPNNESLAAALSEINLTLEIDPDFAAAYSLKAIILLAQYWLYDYDPALPEEAWESIQRGRALDPTLPELDIAEGYYYYWGFRDYQKALPLMERALSALPNNSRVHIARGYVLRRLGDWDSALAAFRRAHELDPRTIQYLVDICFTLIHIHRFDEAALVIEKVQSDDPDNKAIFQGIAILNLQKSGDIPSYQHLNHLLPATNGLSPMHAWRSSIYSDDFDTALQDVSEWPEQNLDTKNYRLTRKLLTGLTLHYSDDTEKARPLLSDSRLEFEALLTQHEGDYPILNSLCVIHGALGDAPAAKQSCTASLAAAPADATRTGWFELEAAVGLALAADVQGSVGILNTMLERDEGPAFYDVMYHPAFDGIRSEPTYIDLLEKYGPVQ